MIYSVILLIYWFEFLSTFVYFLVKMTQICNGIKGDFWTPLYILANFLSFFTNIYFSFSDLPSSHYLINFFNFSFNLIDFFMLKFLCAFYFLSNGRHGQCSGIKKIKKCINSFSGLFGNIHNDIHTRNVLRV